MGFLERNGLKPVKQLQYNSMDYELRCGLWNALNIHVIEVLKDSYYSAQVGDVVYPFDYFCRHLWVFIFRRPADEIPSHRRTAIAIIKEKFFNDLTWGEVYHLIEDVTELNPFYLLINLKGFKSFCNDILKREFSGYTFIGNQLVPITNETEINEVTKATNDTFQFTLLKGANTHLNAAISLLSNKENPDYRNSIKESISAVETVAKIIAGDSKATLGSVLKILKDKIGLHPSLQKGFEAIYGYTSDGNGIRHALTDDSKCDFEDAKYMLVSCSAFINYLIPKSQKAGIKLK